MSEETRKLTVLMSVYNGLPHLTEAIKSILYQTLKDFTFLIIDDGSTDGSSEYLDTIIDPRVQIIHQNNQGLGAALNRGMSLIETEYVARMDADDIALPRRLENQINYLRANNEIGMLGCRFAFTIDGSHYDAQPPLPLSHNEIIDVIMRGGHSISHVTIMFKLDAALRIGGYRINGVGQDWDFFLRMGEVSKLANLNDVLQLVRIHSNSYAWKNVEKTILGQRFAIACKERRRKGLREPNITVFTTEWERRNRVKHLHTRLQCVSAVNYRKYIYARLSNHKFAAFLRLFIAGISSPSRVILRLHKFLLNNILTVRI
jgi:glycosyltransferase involved in cell wall biosynthesis